MPDDISSDLKTSALAFHRLPRPGKLEVVPTKPLGTQRDLALAYSPGVAAACLAIVENPEAAADMTVRQNLVAVISNGTAVLGLGNIGPLASKPVMEGKAVLFKKFAGIDVFDIEVDAQEVDRFVDVVAALEPTFGGVNLEDIKAPECFEIERKLKERMAIPVFHDDQHGTAIIVAAAILNGLAFGGKSIETAKFVTSGAGAAAIACLDLLVDLGARRDNIFVTDIEGVVYKGRPVLMDPRKDVYARDTNARTLRDVIGGADVFLGLSAAGVLKADMLREMADMPLIMALANPDPEIDPTEAFAARPDAMMCTGRSDFPNQVNNVLCFPYIFRGALDVSASTINEAMKHAAVRAIAQLAQEPPSDVVAKAYGGEARLYGKDNLIPSPFDPRLILRIAPAVAKAAMESGVARKPITDFHAYEETLSRFVFRSGFIMKPVTQAAQVNPKRVIFADGEDERVLRAVQTMLEEKIALPILIGRPDVIESRVKRYGLSLMPGRDFELIDPNDDPRYRDYVATYLDVAGRRGITPDAGADARAYQFDGDRGDRAAAGRRGCHDLRPRRAVPFAPALHPRHRRPRARRDGSVRPQPDADEQGLVLPGRHARPARSDGRRDRRDDADVRGPRAPVRPHAEDRARLLFGFRLGRRAVGDQDARRAADPARHGAPNSRSTARCRPIARSRRRCAISSCRPRGCAATPTSSSCRTSMPPTSPSR